MPGVVELPGPPTLAALYRRALLSRHSNNDLPDTTLVLRDVRIDRDRLARYAKVCGYRLSDTLPPTYPHVLAFPLTLAVMAGRDFPFPVVGLVHVANLIEVSRPVGADERLELTVRAADLREHPRGRSFDIRATASVGDEVVWRGVSTYLRKERRGERRAAPPPQDQGPADDKPGVLWRIGRDAGTAYARVCGDRNPIHTSRPAARGVHRRGHLPARDRAARARVLRRYPRRDALDGDGRADRRHPSDRGGQPGVTGGRQEAPRSSSPAPSQTKFINRVAVTSGGSLGWSTTQSASDSPAPTSAYAIGVTSAGRGCRPPAAITRASSPATTSTIRARIPASSAANRSWPRACRYSTDQPSRWSPTKVKKARRPRQSCSSGGTCDAVAATIASISRVPSRCTQAMNSSS